VKPAPPSRIAFGVPCPWLIAAASIAFACAGTGEADETRPPFRYVGSATCSAGGCHGGAGSKEPRGSEFSIWTQQDVHARAFSRLLDEPSKRIAQRLGFDAAHEAERCLKCHSPQISSREMAARHRLATRPMTTRKGMVCTEGVNCEQCHGPAEEWLEPHKETTRWKSTSMADRESLGFRDTRSLVTRAKLCADCHVGSAESGRAVDHDLIAAGHPRLRFEFNSYLANMPAHWTPRADWHPELSRGSDGFVARETSTWAVGQLVAAAHGEKLIASRSPIDFAHFDCHACHHELRAPSWRLEFRLPSARSGTPTLGSWYASQRSLLESVIDVRRTMEVGALSRADVLLLMNGLAVEGAQLSARTWEATSQVYLAMDAVTRDLRRNQEQLDPTSRVAASETADALESIRKRLEFPGSPVPLDSPQDFDVNRVKEIHEQFERIRQAWSATTAAKGR